MGLFEGAPNSRSPPVALVKAQAKADTFSPNFHGNVRAKIYHLLLCLPYAVPCCRHRLAAGDVPASFLLKIIVGAVREPGLAEGRVNKTSEHAE